MEHAAPQDDWAEERLYRVLLNLDSGDWVEVDSFATEDEAEECAKGLADRLATTTEWPRIRGRYLRPETITAVEISERRRWGGSSARASAYGTADAA
jgi:hypothetical protein